MATNPWDSDPIVQPAPGFTGVIPGAPKTPTVPTGFQSDPTRPGHLMPIPGGPEDPSTNDNLDDSTTTFYAQQILAGAPMPAMGMGKVASQNRQKVMAKVAELAGAQGLTGGDLAKQIAHYKAGSKQLSTLETQLGTTRQNEGTAIANGVQFIDRSSELPLQTEYPALNSITQFFQKHTPIEGHDTKVAMDAAWNTFVTEYAKVVAGSPSGAGTLSDSARHEAQSVLQGNYSLDQKKAVFEQMKADMGNRLTAMHQSINEGYDSLVKQPGYAVPDDLTGLSVAPHKLQDHIDIPGIDNAAPPPSGPSGPSGGGGGNTPPGLKELTPDQQSQEKAFLATKPAPDAYAAFLAKLQGQPNGSVDLKMAADRLNALNHGATYNPNIDETAMLRQRIETENKAGVGDNPVTTLALHGATLNLSDEAAGIGNAAANIITSPFTGEFHPGASYQLGRDTERQRIADARETLGYGAVPIEFAGGMASANPTSALAALSVPQMVAQGAKGGAAAGALAGFGQGQGLSQSVTGAGVGGIGGAAVGALAPYAVNKVAAMRAPQGLAPDVAQAAQAEGVDLVRPMVDPTSRGKFGELESNPVSQNTIRAGVENTKGQIANRVTALGDGGTALEPDTAGERVQNAARRFIQRTRGVADSLYNIARQRAGDTRFVPQKAIDAVDQSVAELKANPKTNAGEINFLEGLKSDLSTPGGKTVEELRQLRASLRGRVNEQNLTATQAEGRAIGAMDATHLDAALNLPKGAADAYRRADTFYRERMVHVDDILDRFLGGNVQQGQARLSGEQAFQKLKNMMSPGGDARRLSAMMRDLEPGERQDIAATLAQTLGRRAPDEPFSADRFLTETGKFSAPALRTMFGDSGAESVQNLRTLSRALKDAGGDVNYSRSGSNVIRYMAKNFVARVTGLGAAGGAGFMAGGAEGAAVGALGAAGAASVAAGRTLLSARAMVNPRVSMWLAQAASVSTPSQAKQAVKGLSLVISREPALARELAPVRDFLDQRVTQLLAASPDNGDNEQRR